MKRVKFDMLPHFSQSSLLLSSSPSNLSMVVLLLKCGMSSAYSYVKNNERYRHISFLLNHSPRTSLVHCATKPQKM